MKKIAVLIPCYNEDVTIADVVTSFKRELPCSTIYVYDNCSEDKTAEVAKESGAVVVSARIRGKGNVVRRMFSDIDADIYIMVDGDSTYAPEDSKKMIKVLLDENVDMVVAVRREQNLSVYREGHRFGNKIFNFILKVLFDSSFRDIFSGYRVFSRRFVKTFPITSGGFDIEAELSVHALTLSIPFAELDSKYSARPANSYSKLSTFKDGFSILFRIFGLLKETRPLLFFSVLSMILFIVSIVISYPIVMTFWDTGLVPRFPTAVLATGIMIISFLSLTCGIIMNSISLARTEMKKLHYLHFK
ncbi:MAG: glycosyltransferase family 2 protein [Holosporaceae bacterium]|jgi:glycosyltransferase involved in cell wall biosynthesis|nr:glycosyltransferase family 2 protein [Holosporaceae bacterium]